jgi:hypothetical protein
MNAVKLALVALAGLGLATADIALADTMPVAALPTLAHAHPVKLTRLGEKREAQGLPSNDVGGFGATGIILGSAALAALIWGIIEATKNNNNQVSTGG